MFYHAQSGRLPFENSSMDYITFGKGTEVLIMLPGLGDGLKTVKGTAVAFALMYKQLAKRFKVYCFSRRNDLTDDCTTLTMAHDTVWAMNILGIEKAHILGVSMGGMIAQHIAIHYPDRINKLILAVTTAKSDDTVRENVLRWVTMAKNNDHKSLMIDNVESIYTEKYIKKKHYRLYYPLLSKLGKPKSYDRFIAQANACITHDVLSRIFSIKAPTLIIGGGIDNIVGSSAAPLLHSLIPNSRLKIYDELGHGAYEEAKDFYTNVINFINS